MKKINYTVDAHQHFWNYDPKMHNWISDDMATIRRDFIPFDLQKTLQKNSINYCVYVQVDQTPQHTDQMVQLVKDHHFVKGIVGWIDFKAENIESLLEGYKNIDLIKGFRHIVQGEPNPLFLLDTDFNTGISALKKYNFTYDILVHFYQLPVVLEFVNKHPNQKFIIDHLAKPYIKEGYYKSWEVMIKAIARCENVYCKLSGMVTQADFKHWQSGQITPYMNCVLEAFGPERLVFGSDWPVCLVAASYARVKGLVMDFIGTLTLEEQAMIMGKNANDFYELNIS